MAGGWVFAVLSLLMCQLTGTFNVKEIPDLNHEVASEPIEVDLCQKCSWSNLVACILDLPRVESEAVKASETATGPLSTIVGRISAAAVFMLL